MEKETKGTKLSSYKLPIQKPRSNFDSEPKKKEWYSLAELKSGDFAGITETDSKTSGKEDGPYTPINRKSGTAEDFGGQKLGTTVRLDKHTRIG